MHKRIEEYLEYLKVVRSYSENTIFAYQNELQKYENYVIEKKIDYLMITKQEIREYLEYLDKLHYKNSSISRHITTLRSFYTYLEEKEVIFTNVFKIIHNPKVKRKLPNVLNQEEIRVLFDFSEAKTKEDFREKCIFELLYATGMRVSELSNIKLEDIDYKNKSIRTLGKGKKERIVYYGEYASISLKEYLEKRWEFLKKDTNYLFLNQYGRKLSRSSIEQIVEKRIEKISFTHHISPHTLRHTFATDLLQNGADIRCVQDLLGHEKLSTTQIYTHLTDEYLRGEYLKNMKRK